MKKEGHLSTKIFSAAMLIVCCLGIYLALGDKFTPLRSYEPVGPRPFPVGALGLIAFCAVLLFFFAEHTQVHWGDKKLWQKNVLLFLSLIIFILIFENLGFIIATAVFALFVALIFGAKFSLALPFALFLGVFLFYCFDRWFEVTLPMGYIFG